MDAEELLHAARDAFTAAGGDHLGWPDPHPDRRVDDEEYSRVSRRRGEDDEALAARRAEHLAAVLKSRVAVAWRA